MLSGSRQRNKIKIIILETSHLIRQCPQLGSNSFSYFSKENLTVVTSYLQQLWKDADVQGGDTIETIIITINSLKIID